MSTIDWGVIPAEDKPKDKRLAKLDKSLCKLPANIFCMGSCGSGKSSILWSLLTQGFIYGKKKKSVFDEALIYLGTLDAKETFEKKLPIENKLVLDEFEAESFSEYLNDLKAHQMEKLEDGKPPLNTLIIFDDMLGEALLKRPKTGGPAPLQRLTISSRHECNTTIIFNSQVYKNSGFSTPSIRNNITTYIISRMSRAEIEKIAEEISDDYEPEEWIAIYDKIIASKPYNFVVFDTRRPIAEGRWTEKFHIPFPKSRKRIEMEKLFDMEKLSSRVRSPSESSSDEDK
jgi:hypothetical protein